MNIRVVVPPEPIVTPAEVAGSHAADDAGVKKMIAAVTEEIDGPGGWLGRCLGPQTLELVGWFGCSRIKLPYPPAIRAVSIVTVSDNGAETTVDPSTYRFEDGEIIVASGASWVSQPKHRIRYEAGYNGTGDGKTGAVPERARQAIILSVQELLRVGRDDHELRSETVEGIGSETYVDSDKIAAVVEKTCDRLLSTLRCYIP